MLEEFGRVWKKSNGIGRVKQRTDEQKATLVWLGIEAEEDESDSSTDDESEPESQWKVAFTRFDTTIGDHVRDLPHPPRNDFVQLGPVNASIFGLLPKRARGETPLMAHANSMFSITQWYRSDGGPLKTLLFDSDYDHAELWNTLNLGANDLKRLDLHSRISPFKDVSWNTRGTLCRTYEVIHAPVIHTVDSVNLLFLRTRLAVAYR